MAWTEVYYSMEMVGNKFHFQDQPVNCNCTAYNTPYGKTGWKDYEEYLLPAITK
jgi:hypothetical protein